MSLLFFLYNERKVQEAHLKRWLHWKKNIIKFVPHAKTLKQSKQQEA